VIVGGLLVSHAFTIVLMPALLRLGEDPAFGVQRTPAKENGGIATTDAEAQVGA
jgi:hypothetical protein